jgi:hypothetical protein
MPLLGMVNIYLLLLLQLLPRLLPMSVPPLALQTLLSQSRYVEQSIRDTTIDSLGGPSASVTSLLMSGPLAPSSVRRLLLQSPGAWCFNPGQR